MMVSKHEALAIERFILNVTVPVIYEERNGDIPLGTATLFSLKGRYFLVTARHLFDDPVKPERIACPTTSMKSDVYTLGKCNLSLPTNERFDVAVVELLEPATIERMRIGWQFLSHANVALPSKEGTFLLSGYPASLTTQKQGWLYAELCLKVVYGRFEKCGVPADNEFV